MGYKEKYEQALERAKTLQKTCDSQAVVGWCEYLFPELKESKDERIRKELLEHCKNQAKPYIQTGNKCPQIQSWIAWLEKQGKETSWKPSKEEMDVLYGLAYITNQYDEHKEEVITRLYQDLKREFFNGSSYENMFSTNTSIEDDVRRRNTIQVLEYARSLDTYNQYGKADIDKNIAWLEKQGDKDKLIKELGEYKVKYTQEVLSQQLEKRSEQKSVDKEYTFKTIPRLLDMMEPTEKAKAYCQKLIDTLKKEGYHTDAKIVGECLRGMNGENVAMAVMDGQPITDMVEPKFKVGDWVVKKDGEPFFNGSHYAQITVIDEERYWFDCGTWLETKDIRLWTIQDAKDGDVLCSNQIIVLFKQWEDNTDYSFIIAHAGIDVSGKLQITNEHWLISNESKPATKEQRNTLMKAMADVGYTFDFEKKELKKIEQKPTTIDIDKMVDDYANNKEPGNEIFGRPVPCMVRAYRQGLNDAIHQNVPRYNIGDVLCDKSCTTLNKEEQPNFEILDIKNGMYICDKGSFPISQQDEYELVAKRIEQKMKKFNVLMWDFNHDELIQYDVLPYFRNCYEERIKKSKEYKGTNENDFNKYFKVPETLDEFKKFIESESRYQFWSRCEYEMICHGWPVQKTEEKLDVHDQVMMNIDIISEILYNETKGNIRE